MRPKSRSFGAFLPAIACAAAVAALAGPAAEPAKGRRSSREAEPSPEALAPRLKSRPPARAASKEAAPLTWRGELSREPKEEERVFTTLTGGRYRGDMDGLLCAACAEAVKRALSSLKGIEKVEVDYETGRISIQVAAAASIRMTMIHRAIRRASDRSNLGARFRLLRLRYIP